MIAVDGKGKKKSRINFFFGKISPNKTKRASKHHQHTHARARTIVAFSIVASAAVLAAALESTFSLNFSMLFSSVLEASIVC